MVDVATRSRLLGTCVEFFRRRASRIVVCCLVVHLLLAPSTLRGVTHPYHHSVCAKPLFAYSSIRSSHPLGISAITQNAGVTRFMHYRILRLQPPSKGGHM